MREQAMSRQRKSYSAELKARVALEAIKGQMTVNQIATRYDVHPNLVAQWKQQAIKQMPESFARPSTRADEDDEQLKAQLYQQIGQLKVELDWLKKKVGPLS